ncbi:MAG: putative N-acetylmannosamine-6-phosphate 2-epimerase [Candidatus Eremiobacteraeota bacterium]|nr:putative N-acetylmannosamine-6-phosphate 2-epimerase [Candidatus Eremiobacteraeota bacterium]
MSVLDEIRGGLIVSVQARSGSAIDDPYVLAAMAAAAQANGAVAVRIAGTANLLAVRARVAIPIIGIIKREYPGFEPYITPTALEIAEIVACGAEIVAFDATNRPRPGGFSTEELTEVIHARGCLAMGDCATEDDTARADASGCDIVATTLAGYTCETAAQNLPALGLLENMRGRGSFAVCEGGIASPAQLAEAFAAGAEAVVVGTAITNVDALVGEFAARTDKMKHR